MIDLATGKLGLKIEWVLLKKPMIRSFQCAALNEPFL